MPPSAFNPWKQPANRLMGRALANLHANRHLVRWEYVQALKCLRDFLDALILQVQAEAVDELKKP